MKTKNIFILSAASLVLVACGGAQSSDLDKLKEEKQELKAKMDELDAKIQAADTSTIAVFPMVEISKVVNKDFSHKISVQGTIETDQDALLNAEMGGTITRISAKEGDIVRKGQTLVTLDASMVSSNINEVQTQLEFAEYMLEKQKELKDRGVGSEFDYKQAKSQVDALKSKLKTLGTQRGKSTITAPFSGVIDQVFAKQGEMASPQMPLLRIVNNDKVKITADISESHYSSIQVGTPITVYVPTLKDTFSMNVSTVGKYINPTNRTFRIQAELKNNKILLPNMLAELNLTDENIKNATVVPSSAVLKNQSNEDYIYIAKPENDKYVVHEVLVRVLTKYQGESVIEPKSGELKEGDLVVSKGARGISDLDVVKSKKK